MRLIGLFNPQKHLNKIYSIKKYYIKTKHVRKLIDIDILSTALRNVWELEEAIINDKISQCLSEYKIWGIPINLNNVDWHKDYVSGFEYPIIRFDKIKISKWFDKGIDVKFPWEISRFYFAIKLAQSYIKTKDEHYYQKFKELILSWIDKNTFLFGVNWYCSMELAIRAINWIVALNIFGDIFQKDKTFNRIISKSLIQHAEYISAFPEIYENGHTTNHTTADYAGLLFLALTLKEHVNSDKWIKQAINGLEGCIRYQTYEDGVNFEASIPYHRFVLEMFAYSAIVCRANGIELSKRYYELLFKMFEYTAAYMDHNGNAPQVGDNDSGRILIFHESDEHDHSYLLKLGEHIFDYKFKSQCQNRNPGFKHWLPKIEKINIDELNLIPRKTNKSIAFEEGGAYFLKNDNFSLMVACFPIGQNGRGGHNHYDLGSFTLSIKGEPIVIDPGTYTYTANYQHRNKFKSMLSHNSILVDQIEISELNNNEMFATKKLLTAKIIVYNDKTIIIKLKDLKNRWELFREFLLLNDNTLYIKNYGNIKFTGIMNFNQDLEFYPKSKHLYRFAGKNFMLMIESSEVKIENNEFSPGYRQKLTGKRIIFQGNNRALCIFKTNLQNKA